MEAESGEHKVEELRGLLSLELSPNFELLQVGVLGPLSVGLNSTVRTHFNYSAMSVQQWVTPLEGLNSLRRSEAPMPTPGKGQVLVEVHAVSLNYRDVEGGCSSLNLIL